MARPRAIKSLQDTPEQGGRNWLVYGDSGSGKTVLAGTAPRSLMLMCEAAGAESAKMFGSEADQWILDSWKDLQQAYRYFAEGDGCSDYEWVVLDSLTELEDYAWRAVLDDHGRQKHQPAKQDYPEVWNKVKDVVDMWNRLDVNVLYTAQAFRLGSEDDEGDDSTLLLPLVGSTKRGDTAQKICGKVTLVGYLDVRRRDIEDSDEEESFRRLWIEKTSRMFAKSRHHRGVRYLDEPVGEDNYLDIGEINADVNKRIAAARAVKAEKGGRPHKSIAEPDEPTTDTSGEDPPRRKRRAATEPPTEEAG